MAVRYIDAELLKRTLIDKYNFYPAIVARAIEVTPSADVVEVVRCKDCKHCELRYPAKAIGEEAIEGYYCYQNQRYVKSTDFCSYGERKKDNDL